MNIDPEYSFYNFRSEPQREALNYSVEIEIRDGWGNLVGEVTDYTSCNFVFNGDIKDVEASGFTITGTSPWARTIMRSNRKQTLVHILLRRDDKIVKIWTGRVERASRKMEGPQGSITVDLISDKAWYGFILAQNSPFTQLWIQQKKDIQTGTAIHVMKKFLARNLTRIAYQSEGRIIGNINAALKSDFLGDQTKWPGLQSWMWPVTLVPSLPSTDKTPFVVLQSRMTDMATLFSEACKDYNLYPRAHFHVPGRDTAPANLPMSRAGVWLDIEDKDKARSRGEKPDFFQQFTRETFIFLRGLFGRYDTPRELSSERIDDLKTWFGNKPDDPWVIFRYSPQHWSNIEINAYSPKVSRSVSGGKSPEAVNQGIQFLINKGIQLLGASVGIPLPDLLSGELNDILFAYRDAQDKEMRAQLGPFTFYEEMSGGSVSAYGIEAAQDLRKSRGDAMGYRTATFTADSASFPPFLPFEDFDIMDQVGFEDPSEDDIQLERVKQIEVSVDRDGVTFATSLGESDRPEDPIAIQQRRNQLLLAGLLAVANAD